MPDKRKRPNVAPVSKRSRKELSPSESSGSGSGSEDGMDGGNDRYLESDSEEDEFEGLATYEVDDWDENGGGRAGGSGSGSEGEDDDGSEEDNGDEADIANELGSIPLASLAKAQRSLKAQSNSNIKGKGKGRGREEDLSHEERIRKARKALAAMRGKSFNEGDSDQSGSESDGDGEGGRNGRPESRSSKHAPTALSTKKQVSRTRQIISLPSRQSHDPRFLSTAGRLDPSLHAKGYNFLPELLATEMTQLRQSLAAAVKLEKSCPLREKPQRTAEREEIERDVARLRTKLDRQKIAQREREALAGVNKEERERRKEGKGAWYMKKGEKRDLLLKARFDALQSEGKTALKKAMDRKRKKVAGREKKSRPNVRRAT